MKTFGLIPGAMAGALLLVAGQAAVAEEMPASAQSAGCTACHQVEQKLVGPAWRDIGARYNGDSAAREMLIQKVKAGGMGNWTDVTGGVPMPPYSPRVSDEDIAALIDFILALE
jgi:cytochrome c551/c552